MVFRKIKTMKSFFYELLIIFIVLFFLFIVFLRLDYVDKESVKDGIYKGSTFLPSFRGNYVYLVVVSNKGQEEIFLSKVDASLNIKKSFFKFWVNIYLNSVYSVSNWDLVFYHPEIFIQFGKIRDKIEIDLEGYHSKLYYAGKYYDLNYDYKFENYKIINQPYLVIKADFYPSNKGLIQIYENLYIRKIGIKMNLLKIK